MAIESKPQEIRREISHTREELDENLGALEDRIMDHWSRAKQKIDPVYQTRNHPWIAMGASVAVGALATTALLSVSRRSDETREYPESYASKPGRKLEFARRAASSFTDKFGEEIELAKSIALAAGLKKTADLLKRNFPAVADAVDRVLDSALAKVEAIDGGNGSRSSEFSESEDRGSEWGFKV